MAPLTCHRPPKRGPKGAQRAPKGRPRAPKGAHGRPRAQGAPKGRPKGAQGRPKGAQGAPHGRPRATPKSFGREISNVFFFGSLARNWISRPKREPMIFDQKILAKKYENLSSSFSAN